MTTPLPPVPTVAGTYALEDREPATVIGATTAAVAAVLVLVVAFGAPLTADQKFAIVGVVAPVGYLAQGIWTRFRVWSPASVARVAARHRA